MARRFRDINARTRYPATNPALKRINAKTGLSMTTSAGRGILAHVTVATGYDVPETRRLHAQSKRCAN